MPTDLSGSTTGARKCAGPVNRDFAGELDLRLLEAAEDPDRGPNQYGPSPKAQLTY